MGGYLVGDHTCAHIILVRQGEVLLRSDIAEHGGSEPSDLCATDGGSDMVVAWGDVGDKGTEGVEWSLMAMVELTLHVLLDFLQWHVTRTLDESLHVLVPCASDKFAHRVEFGKLCLVVGISDTTRTQAIAQGQCHVILSHDVADVVEVLVEETFLVMVETPLAHDATSTAHDATETLVGEMHVVTTDASMDGEVIDSLLTLFDECVTIYLPTEVFHLSVHLFQGLVDRHGSYWNRTVAHNPFTSLVDVVACGEIHQRVAAPFARPYRLIHFLLDAGGGGRVADVGIDFHQEVASDNHRLALRVIDVGWQNGTSSCNLITHVFRSDVGLDAQLLAVHVLTDGNVFHLRSYDACLGVCHLGDVLASLGTARQLDVLEAKVIERVVGESQLAILAGYLGELFGIVTV